MEKKLSLILFGFALIGFCRGREESKKNAKKGSFAWKRCEMNSWVSKRRYFMEFAKRDELG